MKLAAMVLTFAITAPALAQTTRPTTRLSEPANPDLMLRQLLSPARAAARPLEPVQYEPQVDQTSKSAIAPRVEPQHLVREGSFVIDRVGRLTRTPDGQIELTFEADGSALKDPPMIILPNLKLMIMESMVKNSNRDLKFRISGMVTEYNARNYILLEMVVQETAAEEKKGDERERR